MTADLVQFLHARLDEDEQAAAGASDGPWVPWRKARLHGLGQLEHAVMLPGDGIGSRATIVTASWMDAEHIARHDPARVLAEVDAKRRILLLHNIPAVVSPKMAAFGLRKGESPEDDRRCAGCGLDSMDDPITPDVSECPILRALALPYAGHPDYRPEWAPDPA